MQREAGLADATHPGERDQPAGLERGRYRRQLDVTADERRRLQGQVSRERVERSQPREFAIEALDGHLEHTLGTGEVAQVVLAEIGECDPGTEIVANEVGGDAGADDLPAVCRGHESCCPVQAGAEVVTVTDLGLARVQAHAHSQRPGRRPCFGTERALRFDCCGDRGRRGTERRMAAVSRRLDHRTALRRDRVSEDLVVARQRALHRLRVVFPESRRSLQVREQERDRPRRQHHTRPNPSCRPEQGKPSR